MEELVERPKNAVPAEDNVDVYIRLDIQTVYDLFKVGNFLNLIKENAGRLSGGQPLFQIGVQFLQSSNSLYSSSSKFTDTICASGTPFSRRT